jgi:hypothetical protein
VDDCNRAQAVELIRALRGQLREMTTQLDWLGRQSLAANEMHTDAATLRRDIHEAHTHIDQLQRRYLGLTSGVGAPTRS